MGPTRRLLLSIVLAGAGLSGLAAAPAVAAGHAAHVNHGAVDPVIYDSTLNPLPGNLPSEGPEAYYFSQFGQQVAFAGSARLLTNVVVTMSDWACQTGSWFVTYPASGYCQSAPNSTFSQQITLGIYAVANDGQSVGPLVGGATQTFDIPYRPTSTTANGCDGQTWYDATDATCYHGLANNITFDFTGKNVVLPDKVIYGISFNTRDNGPHPTGVPGPSDSLNIAFTTAASPNQVSVGSDPIPGTIYQDNVYSYNYCDNGAAGVFRLDSATNACWQDSGVPASASNETCGGSNGPCAAFTPAVQFNATVFVSNFQITTPSVPAATRGAPYSVQLQAAGGTMPYGKWRVVTGKLPRGISLSKTTGLLSGTPKRADRPAGYTFVVQVRDSSKPHQLASQTFALSLS